MVAGHLQIQKGYYYAVVSWKAADGKRKVKWISMGLPVKGNKRKAEAELLRIRSTFQIPKSCGELDPDMAFSDFLEQWVELARSQVSTATYCSYHSLIHDTIAPYFREQKLSLRQVEPRHIQTFYSKRLQEVCPNTVLHYHAVLHKAMQFAFKMDMVPQNILTKVERPKKNSFQPAFLDAGELEAMFAALKGSWMELPVLVAAFYGLRRSEVVGLRWEDIDLERGTITIQHTVTNVRLDGKSVDLAQNTTKTKSSRRSLPLVSSFRSYFAQAKAAQKQNQELCGNCYCHDYDAYVFVDEFGQRIRPNYLSSAFPAFLEKHGLKRIRFHDLRHSCASLLLANGVPLKQIQEWLGHSDFSTTANIYAHLDYSAKVNSAQALETGLQLPEQTVSSRWMPSSADT